MAKKKHRREDNSKSEDGVPGADVVDLPGDRGDYDRGFHGKKIAVISRWTGEETKIKSGESIVIGNELIDYAQIKTIYDNKSLIAISGPGSLVVNTPAPTVSVLWDQLAQDIVADSRLGPTVASFVYALVHTAIYDAWATFDQSAVRVSLDIEGDNISFNQIAHHDADDQELAMHVAAHRVMTSLFPGKTDLLNTVMNERLDIEFNKRDSTSFDIGIDAADDVLARRLPELAKFGVGGLTSYVPVNAGPSIVDRVDITKWSPTYKTASPDGGGPLQAFQTPEWYQIEGFALPRTPAGAVVFSDLRPDEPAPFFMEAFSGSHLDLVNRKIALSSGAQIGETFFSAGDTIDVTKELIGSVINPQFISQAEHIVAVSAGLTESQKLSAEFFEDGPGTSFPPGSALMMAQYVSQRDGHDNNADAKMFMILSNALLDVSIATWEAKVFYEYARPVTVIRDLGALGLIGEIGVDELTGEVGYVIQAYAGLDPSTGASLGTRTILAENFVTYQNPTGFPSPAHAEHTSGHSGFSSAAADVLRSITGSDALGASIYLAKGSSGFDSTTPSVDTIININTFSDYAISAGASRIYGGIHFENGDLGGQNLGAAIAEAALDQGEMFISGQATDADRPFFLDFYLV